jgi:hypothetical protein
MSEQIKVSITPEEWALITSYFLDHKKELALEGITTPTALARRWIREKYVESTSPE